MLSSLRTRFGIPGVISVIALVFAMFGGAYAASNNGGGKATASAKGKPGPRGKTGKTGPAGPAGPAGAKGDTGAAGANGKDGTNGTNGAPGTSVVSSTEATGTGNCEGKGGSKFVTGATTTFACNGKAGQDGKNGEDGEPWTDGGTLPENATETGAFSQPLSTKKTKGETEAGEPVTVTSNPQTVFLPIPFTIPLENELASSQVVLVKKGETGVTHCGGSPAKPEAESGFLCVYVAEEPAEGLNIFGVFKVSEVAPGASTAGARILGNVVSGLNEGILAGTWAVTG